MPTEKKLPKTNLFCDIAMNCSKYVYQSAFPYISLISAIHHQYFLYRRVCMYEHIIVEMSYDAVLLVIGRFSLSHNGCSVVAEVDEEE